MKSRTPTKIEKTWLNIVNCIPCLACELFHDIPDTPAEIHHINGRCMSGAHLRTISLCARHHRHKDNQTPKRWVSRHGDGRIAFEKEYMHELKFLDAMKERVETIKGMTIGN